MDYLEQQDIRIHQEDNICTTCGKAYTHRKRFYRHDDSSDNSINCVDLVTSHAGFRNLVNKIRKLKDELLDLEFTLYCKTT